MKKEEKELKKLIAKSKKILILTHKGPDMDGFCSMLITYKILKDMYPKKDIHIKARQYPNIKLPLMQNIEIVEKIEDEGEDLVIVVDISSLELCVDSSVDTIQNSDIPVVIIDHHLNSNKDTGNTKVVINNLMASATEQVYVSLKEMFGRKFRLNNDIASLVQYGIISDTNRFLYEGTTSDTHRIFAEVKDFYAIDVENYTYKSMKFPIESTPVIVEFLKSLKTDNDMAYMYISKDVIEKNNFTKQGVNEAQAFLRDNYIRFIQGIHWGFIIKPTFEQDNKWYVSFRSTKGYQDVEIIAKELNGGGHMYASACVVKGETVEDVLDIVLTAVKKFTS